MDANGTLVRQTLRQKLLKRSHPDANTAGVNENNNQNDVTCHTTSQCVNIFSTSATPRLSVPRGRLRLDSTTVHDSTSHVSRDHSSTSVLLLLAEKRNNSTPSEVLTLLDLTVEPQRTPAERTTGNTTSIQTVRVQCSSCNKTFQHKRGLGKHMRTFHPLQPHSRTLKCTQQCPLCSLKLSCHIELTTHLHDDHHVDITKTHIEFDDFAKFKEWKEDMERETKSFYTLSHTKKQKLLKIYTFGCHRSGMYVSNVEGNRIRAMKIKGSRKTGKACPSRLTVAEKNHGGGVSVTFYDTHVGHDQDVGHLSLTRNARQSIASDLLKGVPRRKVLEKIASNFSPTERLSCTTNKDLHNIIAAFNLKGNTEFHSDDATSVASFHDVDTTDPLFARKHELIEKLNKLINIVEKSNSFEEIDVIDRNIALIGPALEAISQSSAALSMIPVINRVPPNKRERKQPRLKSLVKKKKQKQIYQVEIDTGNYYCADIVKY